MMFTPTDGLGLNLRRANGYQLPEMADAGSLDQTARLVSRPDVLSGGLGLARSVPPLTAAAPPPADEAAQAAPASTPSPMDAPPVQAPAPTPAPATKPLISFKDNPLGAIGLVLSNVAAGMQGRELPSDQLQKREIERQAMQYKTAELGLNVIDAFTKQVSNRPASTHPAIIDDFSQRFGPALGGVDLKPLLSAISSGQIKDAADKVSGARKLGLPAGVLDYFASDPVAFDKFMTGYLEHISTAENKTNILPKGGLLTDDKGKVLASNPDKVEAPTIHRFINGDQEIDKEFHPETNSWVPVSQGPRQENKTTVNIASDTLASGLGGGAAKILEASQAAAQGAVGTLDTGKQIRTALDSGKVTAGPGTNAITWIKQLVGGDQQGLDQTRTVIQGLAKYVLNGRGALQGQGQISDTENKMLERAASGDLATLSIGEVRTITELNDRVARATLARHKQTIQNTEKAGIPKSLLEIYRVDEPAGASGLPTMKSPDEAKSKLKSGDHFLTPDGRELVVP